MNTNLKNFRKTNNFSQSEIAKKLGYTRGYIHNLEKGKCYGTIDFWVNFQTVFNLNNFEIWELATGGKVKR